VLRITYQFSMLKGNYNYFKFLTLMNVHIYSNARVINHSTNCSSYERDNFEDSDDKSLLTDDELTFK